MTSVDSKSLIGGSIVIEVYCYDETLTGLDEISIIIDGCSLKLGGVADESQYSEVGIDEGGSCSREIPVGDGGYGELPVNSPA
ncbi:hypothetical protein DY000_02057615 [Brassica cretica]|uniref:C2 NT-type domain-containing protein n=1 Tax=Brassica cretica TaxID=69181 RepID=A0ABQ7AL54_BRACR|nr:hypothetical protein DY000_02057615 [Brassica cretica]